MVVSRGLPGVAADCRRLHVPAGVVMVMVLVSNGDSCSERGTYRVRSAQKILTLSSSNTWCHACGHHH